MRVDNIRYVGDGNSMEKAIFFSGAFTNRDFARMQAMYLDINGCNVLGRSSRKGSDGFEYDIYLTQKGYIWFKKPALHAREKNPAFN